MREAAQFAAVRLLHAEVRANGESPALVAALARAYANLGLLTDFHWGPAPAAYKARALLYAQRLVARSPKSVDAVRARAYVATPAGRHDLALTDQAAAAELAAADPAAPPPPAWVDVVDAYVRFDAGRLAAKRAKADAPLARVLRFLAAEDSETPAATLRAEATLLAAEPECYLAHDAVYRVGGISNLHAVTRAGPNEFAEALPGRVREQPGLPAAVAGVAADEPAVYATLRAPGGQPTRASRPGRPWGDAPGRPVRPGLAPAALRGGQVGVDARDEFEEVADALAGHKLFPLLEACGTRPGTGSYWRPPRLEPSTCGPSSTPANSRPSTRQSPRRGSTGRMAATTRCTGRDAAEAATRAYLTGLPNGVLPGQAYSAARFHLMTGRPKKALPLLAQLNAAGRPSSAACTPPSRPTASATPPPGARGRKSPSKPPRRTPTT